MENANIPPEARVEPSEETCNVRTTMEDEVVDVEVEPQEGDVEGNITIQNNQTQEVKKEPVEQPRKRKNTRSVDIIKKDRSRDMSEIWNHFTRLEDVNPPRAACNHCGTTYAAHPKMNGTASMWAHLENCKKYPYRLEKSQKTMHEFQNLSENVTSKGKSVNVEELRKLLAEMIIIDALPFRFVEGVGFRAFVRGFGSKFEVPSRLARDCMKIFGEEKRTLKKIMKNQRVCLTTYTWTSLQNLNYMCLAAHWISSDWKLEKRIINFCIVENHKGEIIAKQVEECLIEWGIDRIFTITVDNATSNDRAINHLEKKMCCAHIVNLIVKEGLEEQHDVIIRVRNVVKYVRSSPARLKEFKKCTVKEKINSKSLVCLDVETRWNSTYMMLEAAEKFEKAFERLGDEDEKYTTYFDCYAINEDEEFERRRRKAKGSLVIGPPAEIDWIHARNFVKFLKIFYQVTLKFSGSSYITSNIFFRELATIHMGLSTMITKGDSHMASMAIRMKEKFNKYWGNIDNIKWLFVAIVLDPRYRLKYVNFCFATMYEGDPSLVKRMTDKVQDPLHLLYKHYADCNCQTEKEEFGKQSSNYVNMDEDDNVSEMLESRFAKHLEKEQFVESKSEIARYLFDGCEKANNDFDMLSWWKVNTPKYHVLSKVSREVLAIPVSTIASESAFSTSGRVIDPFRSSLSPKMVEALVCTQDWLRVAPSIIDLRSAMEDIEQFEAIEEDCWPAAGSLGDLSDLALLETWSWRLEYWVVTV